METGAAPPPHTCTHTYTHAHVFAALLPAVASLGHQCAMRGCPGALGSWGTNLNVFCKTRR